MSAKLLDMIREIAPTSLRYPGGSQSDLYHWRAGIGDAARRGLLPHYFSGEPQTVVFGIDEFLRLCGLLKAEPVLTLNVVTGTAEEAADLVAFAGAHAPPRVRFWEIGNEPYLRDDRHPDLALAPAEYARRYNAFAAAIRIRDPAAMVGVALRSDRLGGVPATPFPGFNEIVLGKLSAPPDFAAVHDAYLPYTPNGAPSDRELYLALMAGSSGVAADFAATRDQLRRHWPGRVTPLAVTEYSAMFTLGKPTDRYITSLAAALYTADLLMLFAESDDLLVANHWSLLGNWYFGAIANSGEARPVFEAIKAVSAALHGRRLPVRFSSGTMATPHVGMVAAQAALPTARALAARDGKVLSVIVLNRDPDHATAIRLHLHGVQVEAATARDYAANELFSAAPSWHPLPVDPGGEEVGTTAGPASLSIVSVELK